MTSAVAGLAERAQAMIDALASISADEGKLTRLYLTEEHKEAARLTGEWMRQAGMSVRMDAAGTMHGVLPGAGSAPRRKLLIGSHIDTVVDAGRFDGILGVVAGILAADALNREGRELPFDIEVLAFGDEEGVRFPKTLIGSSTVAGCLSDDALSQTDMDGVSVEDALLLFGADPAVLKEEAFRRQDIVAYLEVHIEQGPVLDQAKSPLGVVTALASQGRFRIGVRGEAGHAGTVPMDVRHDALAAAAQAILAIEEIALRQKRDSCVATVGEIKAAPGAGNVIPGHVEFSLDLRAASDQAREKATSLIRARLREMGVRRGVITAMELLHEKPVAECADWLQKVISGAVKKVTDKSAPHLMSGAGHDGQSMIHLTDIGMIFVRCRAGISHNPLEHADPEDMALSVEALVETIKALAVREAR